MFLNRKTYLAYAVATACCATSVVADTNANASDDVEVIVVTAAGFEQQLKDAPASISVISRDDLSKRFYRDALDAMLDAPGVIITGGGDRQDISLRGMGSDYTLILVDGKRQSSRETRTNSDSGGVEGAWTPPLAAIERIEVVRGPMSSLYGSDAIGGVINIITRKVPETWQGELRLDTTIQQRSESGNVYQGNFFLTGPMIENLLGVQLYGQFTERKEDDIYSGYRGRKADNLTGRFAFTPTKDHDIILEAGVSNQTFDSTLGKTVKPLEPGESCGRNGCPETSETEYETTKFSLSHTGRWAFGVSDTYIKHEEFDNKSRQMKIRNTDAQSTLVAPVADAHTLSVGLAYNYQDLTDKTGNQLSTGLTDIDRYQWSVFAEDEWRLTDTFALTGGLRMDDDENFGSHFSPRLYGVWQLSEKLTAKGGISTGFRAPSLRQTVNGWGQVSRGGNMYGNPDLEAEKSINYEAGLLYSFAKGSSAGITVFYNEFEDKITRVQCPATLCTDGPNQFGSDPTTYVNVDDAVTQGVEVSFQQKITTTVSVNGSYTFTDSEQKSGQYKGSPLNQLPRHLLQTSVKWQPSDNLSGWARVNYRGKESQPVTGPSSSSLIAPSYTFVDFGGSYQLNDNLTFNAGIYNLFDKEITLDDYGYIEDGRRYWLGLSASF